MADFIDHSANGRRVLMDHAMVQAVQAQRLDDPALVLGPPDGAPGPSNSDFRHNISTVGPFREPGL